MTKKKWTIFKYRKNDVYLNTKHSKRNKIFKIQNKIFKLQNIIKNDMLN